MDLECIPGGAAVFGNYFPDHLPVLGRQDSVSVSIPTPKPVVVAAMPNPPAKVASEVLWVVGDRVEVNVPSAVLRSLQENHGGFNPRMAEIIGKTGVVHRITNNGDVRVQYPGTPELSYRWTVNPKALTKVRQIIAAIICFKNTLLNKMLIRPQLLQGAIANNVS